MPSAQLIPGDTWDTAFAAVLEVSALIAAKVRNRGAMQAGDQISREICRRLQAQCGADVRVDSQTNVLRDLGLDSLTIMDFVMELEEHFDVSMPINRLANVQTVDDLAAVVASLRDGG